MKNPNPDHPIKDYLKQSALALTLGAAMFFGAAPASAAPPVTDGLIVSLSADAVNPLDLNQVRVDGENTFIKQWNDQTANGFNATQTTDELDQPQYIAAGLGGLPVLRFAQRDDDNGSRLYLGDLSANTPTAASVYIVSKIDNDGRYNLFGNRNGSDERWVADTWTESKPGSWRTNRSDAFAAASWPTTGAHVYALNSSSTVFSIDIDGTSIGTDSGQYNSGSGADWTIGNRSTNGQQLRGDIAEVLIYNRVLSPEEAQQVGSYLTSKYDLDTAYPSSPQARIRTFGPGATIGPVVGTAAAISWTVPFGSNVASLSPEFTLSPGATCTVNGNLVTSPSTQDFTNPVVYTVKSSDNAITNDYTVTVTVTPPSSAADITAFDANVAGSTTFITTNETDGTVELVVPFGTDVAAIAPTYTLSAGASSLQPNSAVPTPPLSTTTPVSYLVTAEDGVTTKNYAVIVVVETPSSAADITAFGTNVAGSFAVITTTNDTEGTVVWNVPNGTTVASLAPTYTLSLNATCPQPNPGIPTPPLSTTSAVPYVVTAQDGVTVKTYEVTVVVRPSLSVTDGLIVSLSADAVDPMDSNQVRVAGADTFIKQWKDQTGNAFNATQTVDQDQPLFIANGLNGLPVLRFAQRNEDVGSRLYLGDLSANTPSAASIYIVSAPDDDARYNLFGNRNNDERWVAGTWTEAKPGSWRGGRSNAFAFASWPTTGTHVYALNSSNTAFSIDIDGTSIGTDLGQYDSGSGQNWTIGNRATSSQQLRGDIAEVLIYNRVLTKAEANQVGTYLSVKYGLKTEYLPQAKITAFGPGATIGPVVDNAAAISWLVAPGSNPAALSPTFTLSDGATCTVNGNLVTSGSTQDFTNPVVYTVKSADDATTNNYTVTVTVLTPPSAIPVTDGLIVSLGADSVDTENADQVRVDGGNTYVKLWKDRTANAYNATQTVDQDQPLYIANGLNGRPALRFAQRNEDDGSRLYLGDLSANTPTAASIYIVSTIDNDGRYNLFGNRNNDERWVAGTWNESRPGSFREGRSESANFTLSDWPQTGAHVFALESDSSEFEILINGASIGTDTGAYQPGSGSNWTIGNRSTNSQQLRGDIAEVLIYNRVLTPAEANQVGAYLADKYSLTTEYPPLELAVNLTSPANSIELPSGTPVLASADVVDQSGFTHAVTFHVTPISPAGVTFTKVSTDTSSPYTADLGLMTAGTYEIYATVVNSDSPAGTATSATNAFTVVTSVPTTTTLASSATPSTYGDNVTFTAKVSPIPTGGTVQFFDGGLSLGSPLPVDTGTGEASYSTTTLGAGTHEITAQYSGFQTYDSSTAAALSQGIEKAPLTVTARNVFRLPNTANPDPLPYQITGFKNGQNLASSGVSGAPELSTTAVLESPVGEYPITCTLGTLAADNYSFTFQNATLTITTVLPTVVNVDFQRPDGVTFVGVGAAPDPGSTWNAVVSGVNDQALVDSMAASSGISISVSNMSYTHAYDGPNALLSDYIAGGIDAGLGEDCTVNLTGLPPGIAFDLYLYGIGDQPDQNSMFTLAAENGGTSATVAEGPASMSSYVMLSGNADASGNVSFTFSAPAGDTGFFAGNGFQLVYTTTASTGTFASWAAANAPGQTPSQDHDDDGVENGIEYFMGETGSSFTAMPGLDATNTVTWPMVAGYEGTYEVQTSANLVDWTNVDPRPVPTGGNLSYTLPPGAEGGKSFIRLLVTPTP